MAEKELWSCQRFEDAHSHKAYFISIAHRAAAGQEGTADLALTDGAGAWTVQGVTSASLKGQGKEKLRHLQAALSELEEANVEYRTEVVPNLDGSVDLKVSFQNPGVRVFITASLAAAVPAAPVIASMLELLVGNLTALQATSLDLVQQNKAFEQQLARSQDIVDKYVNKKLEHDKETNIKVAALLNSKKQKLRELKGQLDAAQEEIRRLKEQGAAEPMDEDADREGDGGAGTSKQGSQRQRGRATRVVEDDDEEEEEEEEEERDHSPHGYSDQDAEY